jgi:3-isopropylmalate/(R)-2-methylmalate dehydratase small subunit
MTPFTTLTSVAVPLLRDNIDTDAIIPSREMRSTGRTGLADGLFAPWRYSNADQRIADPEFALNRPAAAGARVLLGGANFGCGSSREHAVWALKEYGIDCIIAPSFAPIFRANCIRNGLLPVELPGDAIEATAWQHVTVDLAAQQVMLAGKAHSFAIDEEAKAMLLEGLDAIDLTLKSSAAIAAWTAADRIARPWVYLEPPQSSIGEDL